MTLVFPYLDNWQSIYNLPCPIIIDWLETVHPRAFPAHQVATRMSP